ncbi:hypothetical protein L6164_009925 [Bauhinia variegata]|uniref:Uncharacterized protein n=1 Tax=Bauhinia variegata TaxID=167791 RepID=A0ACB9PLI7_BAUVA|nr:hypothetical protein L6164_009925 [Bauhinia variegata]
MNSSQNSGSQVGFYQTVSEIIPSPQRADLFLFWRGPVTCSSITWSTNTRPSHITDLKDIKVNTSFSVSMWMRLWWICYHIMALSTSIMTPLIRCLILTNSRLHSSRDLTKVLVLDPWNE